MTEPAAYEVVNPDGQSDYVLTCEHASNHIPEGYEGLGLPAHELERHIAWDIGAAMVARKLAALLDAPLILSGYSRLLIDCNRPIGSPTSIPEVSESTAIPGNAGMTMEEAGRRALDFFWPFQNAVASVLDRRQTHGRRSVVVAVHSFTPVYHGVERPWHAGVLFRQSERFGSALVEALDAPGRVIAPNQPYVIEDDGDYTIPIHGEARGLDAALLELRQDLIASENGAADWAHILGTALSAPAVVSRRKGHGPS